jgi:hypothetical protein
MGREQGVTGAKRHDLTHVKEGDLLAILEHRRDLGGRSGDLWHIYPPSHTPNSEKLSNADKLSDA